VYDIVVHMLTSFQDGCVQYGAGRPVFLDTHMD
jgi:hypothetical protein